jgi:RING-variant domain
LGERNSLQEIQEKRVCRFCLSDTILTENPLLNICKCDGSLKYVHLLCIQSWLTSKLHLKQNNGVLSVLWQGLSCELCKAPLPLQSKTEDGVYDLIDFKNLHSENSDNCPSLLLQSFTKYNTPSGLHFVKIAEKSLIKLVKSSL